MLINNKVILYMLNYKANNVIMLKTQGKMCNNVVFRTDLVMLFHCTDCGTTERFCFTSYSLYYL